MLRRLSALFLSWLSACVGPDEPFPSEDTSTWLFAVLPDTQIYSRDRPEIFEAQTRWLAENAERYRILFVLHEGDIVNDNDPVQWEAAARALRLLDGHVPYVLALGNHDYGPRGSASDRSTYLHDYFTVEEMQQRPSFGGVFETGRLDNSYHVFETPNGPWLVLALEFGPRDEVVAWADDVLTRHASIPAILLTHAYLYFDDTRYDHITYPDQMWSPYVYGVSSLPGGVNDGEELYENLVRKHDSVQLVLNGHVLGDGTARLTSPQDGGSFVHQLLANYQNRTLGGEGYLRLIEVDNRLGRIRVRTYSPLVDAYRKDADDQFELPLPELL